MYKIRGFVEQLTRFARRAAEDGGKPLMRTYADMIWSGLRYGASPANYDAFGWSQSPPLERHLFMTHRDNERLIAKLNKSRVKVLDDKAEFIGRFNNLMGRQALVLSSATREELNSFVNRSDSFVLKPRREGQGRGIKIIHRSDYNIAELVDELHKLPDHVLESHINQDIDFSRSFGPGLAAIRVVTIRSNKSDNHSLVTAIAYVVVAEIAS